MVLTLLLAVTLQTPVAARPLDLARLTFSAAAAVVETDKDTLHGKPERLSWSPDGTQLYLRAVQRDRWGNERTWHYLVHLAEKQMVPLEREPDWSFHYWNWKSALTAPGVPAFKLDVEVREQMKRPTNAGSGGSIAQNTGDPTGPGSELGPQGQAIIAAAMQNQRVTTTTVRAKGQQIAEFVNQAPVFGLTFGWTPAGTGVIAYADSKGRLVVMDRNGRRWTVSGARNVRLPAWSDDGRRLVWIETRRGNTYVVRMVQVVLGP
jgi:hypothetical protein